MPGVNFLKIVSFSLVMLIIINMGCSSNDDSSNNPTPGTDCTTTAATFTQANAIIQSSCSKTSSCHGSGSNNGPGALLNYNQIFSARTSIRSAVQSGIMPQGGVLSATQKATIICWIESGGANN
jgi:uncharacterized membrane protein